MILYSLNTMEHTHAHTHSDLQFDLGFSAPPPFCLGDLDVPAVELRLCPPGDGPGDTCLLLAIIAPGGESVGVEHRVIDVADFFVPQAIIVLRATEMTDC